MHVKRFADAKPYEAPNHRGVVGLRLQGFEPGGPGNQWVGFSQFLPGGAGPDATPFEKVYVVLEGQMTIIAGGQELVLGPMDSCTLAPTRRARSSTAAITYARCCSSSLTRRRLELSARQMLVDRGARKPEAARGLSDIAGERAMRRRDLLALAALQRRGAAGGAGGAGAR